MGKRTRQILIGVAILVLAAGAGIAVAPAHGLAQATPSLQVTQNSTYGAILTTPDGKTLYTFSADTNGQSACNDQCATAWPPATISGTTPTAPAGVQASSISTIVRSDGSRQLTYNGKPLYTFSRDTAAGQVNGNGVNAFNGTWSVAQVSGAASGGAAASSGTSAQALPANGTGGLIGTSSHNGALALAALIAAIALAAGGFGLVRRASTRR